LEKFSIHALNRLALGTAQSGSDYGIANKYGRVPHEEVKSILSMCRLNGINLIDTAIAYGGSESCLGVSGANKFNVVTKLPRLTKNCTNIAEWVRIEVAASMERLQVSELYGLLFHHSHDLIGPEGSQLYDAVQRLRDDGLIKKIGVSIYDPNEVILLLRRYSLDMVQAPLNLVDRRLIESGLLSELKDLGIEVHARSVFLQGLLLLNSKDMPYQFNQWSSLWRVWHEWLSNLQMTPLEACLAYSFSVKGVDRIIVGTDTSAQFMEIIRLASKIPALKHFPAISSISEDLINPSRWRLK
jgi:aryl-alcohol dehydrogenase-like predicted oxidoreductase